MKPKSELILYQTEDNRTRIEVRLENETVWLTQKQMAELFQTGMSAPSTSTSRTSSRRESLRRRQLSGNSGQLPPTARIYAN